MKKKIKFCAEATAIIIMVTFMCGCAVTPKVVRLYEGSPRDISAIALLHKGDVNVLKIDGKKGEFSTLESATIELLPGEHTVELEFHSGGRYSYSYSTEYRKLEFLAEASHQYAIAAVEDLENRITDARIVDIMVDKKKKMRWTKKDGKWERVCW